MNPLDRILSRVDDLIDAAEEGKPIDYAKQSKLDALDMVKAGLHYTIQAVARTNERDREQADERG